MKKTITTLSPIEFTALVRSAIRQETLVEPRAATLQFLKTLARNCRALPSLPEEVGSYVLS